MTLIRRTTPLGQSIAVRQATIAFPKTAAGKAAAKTGSREPAAHGGSSATHSGVPVTKSSTGAGE